jgi:hypothetical protein
MSEADPPAAKVLFRVLEDDGSANVETLWARDLGSDKYRLENSPFFAYSVSWEDIVYAPYSAEEGFPTFQRVVSKSGNRTIRVVLAEPAHPGNDGDLLLQGLVDLGCSYEGMNSRLISINLPPETEMMRVRRYLIERDVDWEHADPRYDDLFPDGDDDA